MVYTKPITGSWFEFLHHNTAEGKYWNETITAFTEEQWRLKLREMPLRQGRRRSSRGCARR